MCVRRSPLVRRSGLVTPAHSPAATTPSSCVPPVRLALPPRRSFVFPLFLARRSGPAIPVPLLAVGQSSLLARRPGSPGHSFSRARRNVLGIRGLWRVVAASPFPAPRLRPRRALPLCLARLSGPDMCAPSHVAATQSSFTRRLRRLSQHQTMSGQSSLSDRPSAPGVRAPSRVATLFSSRGPRCRPPRRGCVPGRSLSRTATASPARSVPSRCMSSAPESSGRRGSYRTRVGRSDGWQYTRRAQSCGLSSRTASATHSSAVRVLSPHRPARLSSISVPARALRAQRSAAALASCVPRSRQCSRMCGRRLSSQHAQIGSTSATSSSTGNVRVSAAPPGLSDLRRRRRFSAALLSSRPGAAVLSRPSVSTGSILGSSGPPAAESLRRLSVVRRGRTACGPAYSCRTHPFTPTRSSTRMAGLSPSSLSWLIGAELSLAVTLRSSVNGDVSRRCQPSLVGRAVQRVP